MEKYYGTRVSLASEIGDLMIYLQSMSADYSSTSIDNKRVYSLF